MISPVYFCACGDGYHWSKEGHLGKKVQAISHHVTLNSNFQCYISLELDFKVVYLVVIITKICWIKLCQRGFWFFRVKWNLQPICERRWSKTPDKPKPSLTYLYQTYLCSYNHWLNHFNIRFQTNIALEVTVKGNMVGNSLYFLPKLPSLEQWYPSPHAQKYRGYHMLILCSLFHILYSLFP